MSKRWVIGIGAVVAVTVMALLLLTLLRGPQPPRQAAPPPPTPSGPGPEPGRPNDASPEYPAPKTVDNHGATNATFTLSDGVQRLTGQAWTQSGHKGSGDVVVTIESSGTSTVRGGVVRGDYPTDWTWSYLKTDAHYNGMAFRVPRAEGELTFDGQYTQNIAVDSFRVLDAPKSLTIKNVYAFDNRDDFVSYPNEDRDTTEDGGLNTLRLEDNLVHTFTWLSWRNSGGNDSDSGEFRLKMSRNLVHLKPQAGSGDCTSTPSPGKVAGRHFKMEKGGGFTGSRRLFEISDNIWWIEQGSRDSCIHDWPDATYRDNVIYYSGPADKQAEYLGEVPAGVRVLTGAEGRAAWEAAVAKWVSAHSPAPPVREAAGSTSQP